MPDINDPRTYDGPEWNPVVQRYAPVNLGDGRDGVQVFSVNATLTADVRAQVIVIAQGVTIVSDGFELVAQDLILNNGTLSADGQNAAGAVPGNGAALGVLSTAGIRGGNGGARTVGGGASTGTGNASGGGAGAFTAEALGAAGGAGGGGGAAGGNNGGTTLDPSVSSPFMGPYPTWTYGYSVDLALGAFYVITVGCGGGGGDAAVGGAGGGGATMNRLRARRIINNGIISARGGRGSDATGVNGSGGGGGGGGRNIASGFRYGNGLWLVNGGAGGAGNGTGTAGSAGANGTNHFFE